MRKTAVLLTVLGLGLATLFSATSTAPAQGDTSGRVTLEVLAGAGASVGDGEGMAALKSQNGVEMALTATGQGIWLSLPHGGVDVKLKQ